MSARMIMKLHVSDVYDEAPDVRVLTLRHPIRRELPESTPGAHVDLRLPNGKIRQYSLIGDPTDRTQYRIAVKREDDGRGGSRWVHESLKVGSEAHVSAPRNNFGLSSEAQKHVLVAGGIGVTPFLAMVQELSAADQHYTLHYSSRQPVPPFSDFLKDLCGDSVSIYTTHDPQAPRFDAETAFKTVEDGTHIYCCGPASLIDAVKRATAHWPPEQVHFEVFEPVIDENFTPEPFDIRIASTDAVLHVPADRSALDVLREEGFVLPSSCELGVCGTCKCTYSDGTVIHRDQVLSTAERQDQMMLCVSRARVRVTLDL